MSVHYKFKSNLDHDTVTFDGLSISVADLKKSIMQQKKIGKSSDFDLQITNAQTKEVYDSDEMLVPKNTSVIVARVPVATGNKKNWDKPELPLPLDDDDLGQIRYDRIVKTADLVNANTTEEDKVKAMITQSSQEYDPSKYVKSRSMTGPLPPTYTCYRCGKQGHWIKNCPTNNPDVKRSTGIPRSFMVPVDGPEHKGALLTSSGDYAVPLIDHQAYKEVKKEKPPFVAQEVETAEVEAQIPEELLCMVCKDLLQDAVLIPCCGNSFCDECVRQVLLESDNHECPVCHEIEVSPNTLIPNRFLRTAVLNFKNETGYTRIKRSLLVKSPPSPSQPADSPQPSPDSTVENNPQLNESNCVSQSEDMQNVDEKKQAEEKDTVSEVKLPIENVTCEVHPATDPVSSPKPSMEDASEDAQPGTPLADEPPVDDICQPLPVKATCDVEKYDYALDSKCSHGYQDECSYCQDSSSLEPKPISTIETITNIRKTKFSGRPAPVRQQFLSQRNHHEDRSDVCDRDDYRNRYDRRHHVDKGSQKSSHHSRYERSPRESRYHYLNSHEYPHSERECDEPLYDPHLHNQENIHQERYRAVSHSVHVTPTVSSIYAVPNVPVPQPLLPTPQVYASQPPPPGASPVDTSQAAAQPPPPGVGPLLPPVANDPFSSLSYESEDPLKDSKKVDERSIDDRLEAFQRELEKRDRAYSRDRGSCSRSRSTDRERSRSSSRSRSYSSKSWTRSPSRSSTRTSRSRSRTPFSSRSRSRSYSHSRSRSWSKARSYTRSRSRTRTDSSRSRSRSRTHSRLRRRCESREKLRSPRLRTRSRSFSPKEYRSSQRSLLYSDKHSYTPPQFEPSFQHQYGPPQAILPLPVMRPAFPSHHMHSMHPSTQAVHPRTIEQHYPIERHPKYPSYGEPYSLYSTYQPKYQHQRFDREQRMLRYEKRQDFQWHQEEVGHRIPGWVNERSRDYKSRYRQGREQQRNKEIKELPKVPESDVRIMHIKEPLEVVPAKKREDKIMIKHKKHHHHHKSKEIRKQDKQDHKIPVVISNEKALETSRNLIKVEVSSDKVNENKSGEESLIKTVKGMDKNKDKKHKHKKHKSDELLLKKKKSAKKEKSDNIISTDSDLPVKVKAKKKKSKLKTVPEKQEENAGDTVLPPVVQPKVENSLVSEETIEEPVVKTTSEACPDTLDIFADEAENESVLLTSSVVAEADSSDLHKDDHTENCNASEAVEENVEDENVLCVDVPALSKWEREDLDDDFVPKPQRKSAVVVPKDDKGALSSDIIQRAELALLSKPFKPRVEAREKNEPRDSSTASSPEMPSTKCKELPELKSVVNSERLASPNLQVTISTMKEKRSVHSRKEEKMSKDRASKRSKLDHSKEQEDVRRKVTMQSSKGEEKLKEQKNKTGDRHEKKSSLQREVITSKRKSSYDHNRSGRSDRGKDSWHDEENVRSRAERRYKFVDHDRHSRNTTDYNARDGRSDKKGALNDHCSYSFQKRYNDRESSQQTEKSYSAVSYRTSRSRSYDSSKSCLKRKRNDKLFNEQSEELSRSDRSSKIHVQNDSSNHLQRLKHSPIKPPEKINLDCGKTQGKDFNDDLKFEPDYDEYSDSEEKVSEAKGKYKKKHDSPDISKKHAKMDKMFARSLELGSKDMSKTDKSSVTSSSSSTVVSGSDSSDSEDQKGSKSKCSDLDHKQKHKKSRHKKHKKHKHKHKKKKSHKSKLRE